jgi:serine/threonine-protein kinase ATR
VHQKDANREKIQRISIYSLSTPMRLFTPYWRTIAVMVVQDLQRRPQVAQQMSDLLAMTVTDFLRLTQYYTTPVLVLTKKRDILQRVAGACGRSIKDQCMDHNNLAAILAYILLQPLKDTEEMIMGLLQAVSAEFDQVDCAELVKGEPMLTASELLKAAGENDDVKRSRVSYDPHNYVRLPNVGLCRPTRRLTALLALRTVKLHLPGIQLGRLKSLAHSSRHMSLV